MIKRALWLKRLQQAWNNRSIVWLSGVRRIGKTTLARMLPDAVYMNCDLPSAVRALEDPELFLNGQVPGIVLVFDEVHRLEDPSRLMKIAADEYPQLKILATGSSTLAATRKFRDSLTGRKQAIHLCPVLWSNALILLACLILIIACCREACRNLCWQNTRTRNFSTNGSTVFMRGIFRSFSGFVIGRDF